MKTSIKRQGIFTLILPGLLLGLVPLQSAQAQTWATNNPMQIARWHQTATELTNGLVLIAGGIIYNVGGNFQDTNECELYNPATGVATPTASMQQHRSAHTATLLPDGTVLEAGGAGGSATSETYDPVSGTWSPLSTMRHVREVHTATLLPDGLVLVAGGYDDNNGVELASAELYDPSSSSWFDTGSMSYAGDTEAAALLSDGTVLVCGGSTDGGVVPNAAIYDPNTETWTDTTPMNEARAGHTATTLKDGRVLVEGGDFSDSAEVYDPNSATWTYVASMNDGRQYSEAALLPGGQVMVIGDNNPDVEIYDPVNDEWNLTDSLPVAGYFQTITVVTNGQVVVTGGAGDEEFNGPAESVIETYVNSPSLQVSDDPESGTVPLTVQFTSPGTDTSGNPITSWNWDFDDGTTSTAQNPSHTYNSPGSYFPSLTAFSASSPDPLNVTGPDPVNVFAPYLEADATPQSGQTPLTVQFSTPNQDSGGHNVTNWSWSFGDGASSTAHNPTHTYVSPGSYTSTLTAYTTYSSSPVAILYAYGSISVTNPPNPNFRTLYTFSASSGFPIVNNDGSGPNPGLILSGHTLYGTTVRGGTNSVGTLFAINTDATGFTNLFNFSLNAGSEPSAGLVLSGRTLYGSLYIGNSPVFAISTNGTGFTNIDNPSQNGATPDSTSAGSLILLGNTLYGTTQFGGAPQAGTVFSVNTNGSGYSNLHTFSSAHNDFRVNGDGDGPLAGLIFSGSTLYGTTEAGGPAGSGAVFAVDTNSPGSFRNLHYFTTTANPGGTNADGGFPFCKLVQVGSTLYGTAFAGGFTGNGTIFAVTTNGSSFSNLYNFTGGTDGGGPHGGLTVVGNTLYGTTSGGGSAPNGTLFSIHTDGTGFTTLYTFSGLSDGSNPGADLLISSNVIYGTCGGGGSGNGTLYSYILTQPGIILTNIVKSPTSVHFTFLQTAGSTNTVLASTNLALAFSNWTQIGTAVEVLPGQFQFTDTVVNLPRRFYRIRSP